MALADCTVMVVEDHEFQRRTTLQILANLGAGALLEAADGEGALALLGADPRPDIVICDLDMPGMDGVEFLRHVSELRGGTAIVIASGLDDGVLRSAETTARGYGLEVLGAIRKPLTARRLLQAVGLHRPATPGVPEPPVAGDDPWAAALRDGRVAVLLRPRVDLASGRLGAIEARAHRIEAPSAAPISSTAEASSPPAFACSAAIVPAGSALAGLPGPQLSGAAPTRPPAPERTGAAPASAAYKPAPPTSIDAATDSAGPATGEVACAIADLVARAGLAAQHVLSEAGELVDVTLVLPPSALAGTEVVDRFTQLAAAADVEVARVCVALPDARGASPAAAPLDLLTRLRVRGFGLGIDGFGAARATLPELGRLPLTEVKIAADALARAAASTRGGEAFAATVQALIDQGLDVVCDGCDSPAEWELALQAGCRRAQGALVGPPLAPEDLAAWLASWSGVA
jgi:EAL domain-containing protein (putative c-di-GMP-specific phosphodiesterase class I)/CheY-like chemotaxis protein